MNELITDSENIRKEAERSLIKTFREETWSRFIKAINEYELIKDGDRIAVCISGGKDSMMMAKLFQELYNHGRKNFEPLYLVMDPGYNEVNRKTVHDNAVLLGIPVTEFRSEIFRIVDSGAGSPCYPCARMRRGALYSKARELGCNKIALGHHYDDVIETILMGMLYGGQFQTMMPKLHSQNFPGMELIRPLYLIREDDIKRWMNHNDLHFIQCACRLTEKCALEGEEGGSSKRAEIKALIRKLHETNEYTEANIFKSVENVNLSTIVAYKKDGAVHHFLDEYDKWQGATASAGSKEEKMTEKVLEEFRTRFGAEGDIRGYFAPGRVNLIGEHTDYNGGHVFPCALTMGNYAAARKRDDMKIRWYNMTYPQDGVREADITKLAPNDNGLWYDYQQGVIWAFQQNGYNIPSGYDMVMMGDIPAGAGLSASASIEELAAIIIRDLFSIDISMQDCARMGQYSENRYNGMNCGIMDQFASAMGKKDCAIFLDTATLKFDYVPLNLKNEKIVITNSKVKHKLAGSAYNDRRRESETALADLQTVVDIKSLGDLDEAGFEKYKAAIKDPVCLKRAKHAVYENQRTIKAVAALKTGDIEAFGKLMNESHVSLRDDYEVSCSELDILAGEAWKADGVIGSRMTGGGFGGCTVSIVRSDEVDSFRDKVGKAYTERTGNVPEFYIADAADGARRVI